MGVPKRWNLIPHHNFQRRVTTWKTKYNQKRKYLWFISSSDNRFYIFILWRIAKKDRGRFLSPRFLYLDLAVFLWINWTRLYEDWYLRRVCMWQISADGLLSRQWPTGLQVYLSFFYFAGWFPFFVSGFHNDLKGSVNVFGECWWNLFGNPTIW